MKEAAFGKIVGMKAIISHKDAKMPERNVLFKLKIRCSLCVKKQGTDKKSSTEIIRNPHGLADPVFTRIKMRGKAQPLAACGADDAFFHQAGI